VTIRRVRVCGRLCRIVIPAKAGIQRFGASRVRICGRLCRIVIPAQAGIQRWTTGNIWTH